MSACLEAVDAAFAAFTTAIAALFANEATAERGQAALEAAATATRLLGRGLLLVLHLLLRRVVRLLARRRAVGLLRVLRVALGRRRAVLAGGRALLVILLSRHDDEDGI
jgi:hypothetical protein